MLPREAFGTPLPDTSVLGLMGDVPQPTPNSLCLALRMPHLMAPHNTPLPCFLSFYHFLIILCPSEMGAVPPVPLGSTPQNDTSQNTPLSRCCSAMEIPACLQILQVAPPLHSRLIFPLHLPQKNS